MRRLWLLSASLLPLAQAAAAPVPASTATTRPAWPQTALGLIVDPAVRFGTLPNGLRYAIMRNATPRGEASLRLRIDAGSLNERDDQRGVAHFLEHMVLNGTKNVPEGDFVKRLERAGLRFGPDTNASTDFEQTVFKLDLPKTDDATFTEAMFLLREVADEATLDAKAIDGERGIILSEERTRASPGYRAALDEYAFLLKGQLLPTRFPIGDTAVIRDAPRARFAEFYDGYYRPERAAVIAVGDFDVDAMEARIRTSFGSWTGEGPALASVDQGKPAVRGREARLFVEPGLPNRVAVTWVRPADLRPDGAERRREGMLEGLAFRVLNRRLERIATGANPPFVGAGAGSGTFADSAERSSLTAVAAPGRWNAALAAITTEQRRFAAYGVTQPELDRELGEMRTSYVAAASRAATRATRALAEQLVSVVDNDWVPTTPAGELAFFEEAAKRVTVAAVNAAARPLFSGSGPLIYMTSPAPIAGGETALLGAHDGAARLAVTPPVTTLAKPWPYQSFGAPGAVVERREIGEGIGATAIRFANGTRLTIKKTDFKDDQIFVEASFPGGFNLYPLDGRPTPGWNLGNAVGPGGLGKLTFEELQQTLSSKVASVSFDSDTDRFSLAGSTRPADLALQMKLLAAYYTDPAWRPTGWDRSRSLADAIHGSMETTPGGVLGRDLGTLLHPGDPRYRLPSRAEMKAMDVAAARAVLASRFGRGPVELTIAGDVDVDAAIAEVAATFGALPVPQSLPVPQPPAPRFPAANAAPVRLTHKGREDQALAYIAWPTAGLYPDVKRARMLGVLSDILQLRLTAEIREKQGTTYSPSVGHTASDFYDYGYMAASIQAPPDKLDGFLRDAMRIAGELRDTPVTTDELDRARKPSLANIARERGSSNGWWMSNLESIQTDPRVAPRIRSQVADYEAITPADLQRVARAYLRDATAWKLVVVPEAKAAAAVQTATGTPARP